MKKIVFLFLAAVGLQLKAQPAETGLRAPAYPLVTVDPYTSAWSFTDKLYEDNVKHWTGAEFPLVGALRVDGVTYRFMGVERVPLKGIAPISYEASWEGRFTLERPKEGWTEAGFDDSSWDLGKAAFGTPDETNVQTQWLSRSIWVRRNLTTGSIDLTKKLFIKYSHDDTFELYVNGVQIVKTGYVWRKDVVVELSDEVKQTFSEGRAVIAAHCRNRTGGALVDFGLYTEEEVELHLGRTAVQKSVKVEATRSTYVFECGAVELELSFTAPFLMNELDLLSRPVNYISYRLSSLDGKAHQSEIYFEASPQWALNKASQPSEAKSYESGDLLFVRTGSKDQKILNRSGDDVRIDWGYFYLCSEKAGSSSSIGNVFALRDQFVRTGAFSGSDKLRDNASIAISQSAGKVKTASGKILVGYDDIYSIQYFGTNLRPYWNRDGKKSIESIFSTANAEFKNLDEKCKKFDAAMFSRAVEAGGREYAELCALAYRQSISAHKLVEAPNGDLLFLSKENFSNGSIGTVDVTYPSAPLYLLYSPELVKGLLNHIFYYSESGRWTKPFPAHDVGTYPLANGQTYGGDMPVEEAGNMLILTAALAKSEGNALYASKHWDVLTIWTDYLVEKGLDPENQLCTDDFAGHFAHNVNLSVKAIMGIAAYAYLADMLGKKDLAKKYTSKAKEMAAEWMKMADDGDHYRLTFDKQGTWSQKYNLVWDKIIGLNIFPKSVVQKEIAWYLQKQNIYGLPLDNRKNYTKSDWIVWTATLSDDKSVFEKFISPLYKFVNETEDRIPMSDWYNTDSKKHVGFRARSVVGGYFIKMLF
ncbi:MAG: DUF4965 domain-containing protein [Prevotellaceae bacterium]|jgi:hypothetical protein|nr:DUF4965 domain-containing protein [Prevotellaceae bacterium]